MAQPFKKPIKQTPHDTLDPFPGGRDRTSYQHGQEYVFPFNNDAPTKSPTDMSDSHKKMDLNQFLPRPKGKNG